MTDLSGPGPTHQQRSGRDAEGRPILSVLAKRTYRFDPAGRCVVHDEQIPLQQDVVWSDEAQGELLQDIDLYPFKPGTDIVVRGHAYPTFGRTSGELLVRCVGGGKRIAVSGDRRAVRMSTGRLRFTDPTPFEKLPLSYSTAYGGHDAAAEKREGNPYAPMAVYSTLSDWQLRDASPYTYRRNFIGRGFIIDDRDVPEEGILLPNFEYPEMVLSPGSLCVEHEARWAFMPLPAGVSWFHPAWYPRIAWAGLSPLAVETPTPVPEEALGWAPAGSLDPDGTDEPHVRALNGASPGLTVPYYRGGEQVELTGVFASPTPVLITLPTFAPMLAVDGRNGTLAAATDVVMHTVDIEPDEWRLSITWRGSAIARRPYLTEELAKMPYRVQWRD